MDVGSNKIIISMAIPQYHMVNHIWSPQDQWTLVQFLMKTYQKLMDLEIIIHLKNFYKQFIIRLKYVTNLRKQICKLGSFQTIHIIHLQVKVIMQFLWTEYQEVRLTQYLHRQHGRLERLWQQQIYTTVSHWELQLTILQIMQCLQEYNGSYPYNWFHKYLWYKMMNCGIITRSHKCLRRSYWLLEMHHLQN